MSVEEIIRLHWKLLRATAAHPFPAAPFAFQLNLRARRPLIRKPHLSHTSRTTNMLKRAFSTLRPLQQEATAAATPLRRTKDPLLSSSTAQHFTLPTGSHFVIRAPPSTLPPSHPVPSTSTTSAGQTANAEAQLPVSRTRHYSNPPAERKQLSTEEVAALQALRRSDPAYWTRSKLATKFSISKAAVGTVGWGEGAEGRAAERSRQAELQAQKEATEARWGWKKEIAKEERRRRRTMW